MVQDDDRVLLLLTETVSDVLETPIEDLPPLSESINVDGLDAVVNQSGAADVSVVFSYANLCVFVHSEGLIYVRPTWEDGAHSVDSSSSNRWVSLVDERVIDRRSEDPCR